MKKIFFVIFMLSVYYLILNTFSVFADSKILINEFLIDPQPQSVEIYNSGTESADISSWIIDDSGGATFYTIPKENIIFPNQCLVFSADFNLNKTSADTIKLINSSQQLIDSFTYKSSSGSGISFFRTPDGTNNWATGSANLGFYNSSREQKCLFPTLTPKPTLTPTITPTPIQLTPTDSTDLTGSPTPTQIQPTSTDLTDSTYLTNIFLSEVMSNPVTREKEWVEIYNNNDFSVSLNNWYIDDLENAGSSPKIFSLSINAKSYGVFDLNSSIFNNDGDSVRLMDFNKNLKDDFEYGKNEQGKTLGRTSFESDDFCLQEPSKNAPNNSCINPTPTPFASPKPTAQAGLTLTSKPTPNNQFMITKNLLSPVGIKSTGQVLGTTNEIIMDAPNNKPLINLLCFLSSSYSLLTIISILFRMKLSYGKDKNFYSPSLHSS